MLRVQGFFAASLAAKGRSLPETQSNYRVTLITVGATITVALISGAFAYNSSTKQAEAARVADCRAEISKREAMIRSKADAFLSGVAEAYLKVEANTPIPAHDLRGPMTRAAFSMAAYTDSELAQHTTAITDAFEKLLDAIRAKTNTDAAFEKLKTSIEAWQPEYQRQFRRLKIARENCA